MAGLEDAIRGSAVGLLLLLAALALRAAPRSPARLFSALFALSVIAYTVTSAPDLAHRYALWLLPLRLVSMTTSVTFWFWSRAVFDDDFRPGWRHAAIWFGVAALGLGCLARPEAHLDLAINLISLGFIGLGIREALSGRSADLVEGRRRLRPFLALAAATCAGGIVLVELFWHPVLTAAPGSLVSACGVAAMAFIFAWTGVHGEPELVPSTLAPISAPSIPVADRAVDARDAAILAALQRLMVEERTYRESGLGVAVLADRLGIPEYRLRRLINGELGHRNFSAFVNGYRLAEVKAALADPSQAEVPILTIALDAGFQSIGPFNRAFKLETGTTPTEYRRARLGGPVHDEAATGRI